MNDQNKELWQNILEEPYCDPSKRMDFVIFFDVRDGNPNGDPDAGNLPRMDPETRQGIVTDVCIKRKIRDYLAGALGRKIYIQSKSSLNSLYFEAANNIVSYNPEEDKDSDNIQQKKKLADKEAVEVLLAVLNEDRDVEFKELLAIPEEEPSQNGKPELPDKEQKQPFREWLASIDIDGLEFDPDSGEISYLGEAKLAKDFKALFTDGDIDYQDYDKEIGTLAKLLANAKTSIKGGGKEREARKAIKSKMCELYEDIRLFGAVLTAGTNAGQIRGPMQLTFGRSIEPILQMDAAITRCAITKTADWKKKQTEFGRKPWLNWAIYRQHGFFNPLLGRAREQDGTGITKEDLARFWEALARMFRNSDSASKGEMTMHDIIVFVHNNHHGSAPSHLLFNTISWKSCKIEKTTTRDSKQTNIISRDGFDKCYEIKFDAEEELTDNKKSYKIKPFQNVKAYRPLQDLWGL